MTSVLGEKLRQFRSLKELSLRDVEEKIGISNAYLSQLERGHAKNPSPRKLELLAKLYNVPYSDLLRSAGYLNNEVGIKSDKLIASSFTERPVSALVMAIQDSKLTADEENMVAQYVTFLKTQRK